MVVLIRSQSHCARVGNKSFWDVNLCGRTNENSGSKGKAIEEQENTNSEGKMKSSFSYRSNVVSERIDETKVSIFISKKWWVLNFEDESFIKEKRIVTPVS